MSDNPVDRFKSFNVNDQVVLASGVLAFIFSFFPYWGASAHNQFGGSGSASVTAWHSYSTIGLLLILAGTAVTAVLLFARDSLPDLAVGPRWIAAGLCALGALLYLIRLFTLPSHSESFGGASYSYGVKWGGWLLLIIVLVNAAFAVMSALSSDESKPWASMGGGGGAAPPPPAPPAPPAAPPTA